MRRSKSLHLPQAKRLRWVLRTATPVPTACRRVRNATCFFPCCRRFRNAWAGSAQAHGVASFYELFSLTPRPPVVAHVCDDIACMTRGAGALCGDLERKLGPAGSPSVDGKALWQRSSCLGLCERAPAALITAAGETPRERIVAPAKADSISSVVAEAALGRLTAEIDRLDSKVSVPQAGQSQLRLLGRLGQADPASVDDYRRLGGYEALKKALDFGAEHVIREVIDSKLLGRGGAAFPAGKKWQAVHAQRNLHRPHYVRSEERRVGKE